MSEYDGISNLTMTRKSLTGVIGALNPPKIYVQYEEEPEISNSERFRKEFSNVIPTPLARRNYSECESIGSGN